MRADRLVCMVLLLQARGRMTARDLAGELEVSVRTVYRDLAGLSAAGVPVLAEAGAGGGCRLPDGYRFPLRGLRPEEAEALLILGVPGALRELGLDAAARAAHRQIRVTAGLGDGAGGAGSRSSAGPGRAAHGNDRAPAAADALVHLDLPRWFRSQEQVPQLRVLAEAVRGRRLLAFRYRRGDGSVLAGARASGPPRGRSADAGAQGDRAQGDRAQGDRAQGDSALAPAPGHDSSPDPLRVVAPLGLVNKAGTWYLVGIPHGDPRPPRRRADGGMTVFRAGRISSARVLAEAAHRPEGFDLAGFWEQWSREFAASRPRLKVRLRACPQALAAFGEVFGDEGEQAARAALPPGEDGWQQLTLSFEHELAAAHRLAGFGGQVEVLSPAAVRERLVATATAILDRYALSPGEPAIE